MHQAGLAVDDDDGDRASSRAKLSGCALTAAAGSASTPAHSLPAHPPEQNCPAGASGATAARHCWSAGRWACQRCPNAHGKGRGKRPRRWGQASQRRPLCCTGEHAPHSHAGAPLTQAPLTSAGSYTSLWKAVFLMLAIMAAARRPCHCWRCSWQHRGSGGGKSGVPRRRSNHCASILCLGRC